MKRLGIAVLIFTALSSFGQKNLKGTKGVGVDVGMTDLGYYLGPTFNYSFSSRFYLKSSFLYERGQIELTNSDVNINSLYLGGGSYYNLFDIKDFSFFDVGVGLQGTMANINDTNEGVGSFSGQEFDLSLFVGGEIRFFVSEKVILLLNHKQTYQPLGNFGKWIPFTGAGAVYNF